MRFSARKNAGLTLLELLIAMSIFIIVLTIGVPSFNALIRSSAMTNNGTDLVTALNYARMEAVKRGDFIEVAQQDGTTWTSGLIVRVEGSGAGEELRLWSEFNSASSVTSAESKTSFVFDPSGQVDNADVLTLCDDRIGETGRAIHVLASGAVYAGNVNCE